MPRGTSVTSTVSRGDYLTFVYQSITVVVEPLTVLLGGTLMVTLRKITNFSKGFMVCAVVLTAFVAFTSLVAASDFYLSKVIVDLLYSWGLITFFGYSVLGFTISLLLILPCYFFWLAALVVSYSFACEKLNVPFKYCPF